MVHGRTRGGISLVMIVVSAAGCHGADQVSPRNPPVVWSAASERQAVAVQAILAGQKQPGPAPVVFIDGQRYTGSGRGEFAIIDPRRIATIQALTGADAEARAGAAGGHGVIWITTKPVAASR